MQLNELTKKLFDINAKYDKDITIDAKQMSELFNILEKHPPDDEEERIQEILEIKTRTKISKLDLTPIFNKYSEFYKEYQKDDDAPFDNSFIDIAGIIKCDLRYDSKLGHARFINFLCPENKISIRLSFGMWKNVGVSITIKDDEGPFIEFLVKPENGELFTDKSFQERVEKIINKEINKRKFKILKEYEI